MLLLLREEEYDDDEDDEEELLEEDGEEVVRCTKNRGFNFCSQTVPGPCIVATQSDSSPNKTFTRPVLRVTARISPRRKGDQRRRTDAQRFVGTELLANGWATRIDKNFAVSLHSLQKQALTTKENAPNRFTLLDTDPNVLVGHCHQCRLCEQQASHRGP